MGAKAFSWVEAGEQAPCVLQLQAQLATAVPGQQPSRPALRPTEPAPGEQHQPEAKRRREEMMAFDEAALSANGV